MNYSEMFPFFNKLSKNGQELITKNAILKEYNKKINVNTDLADSCLGIIYIISGEVRAYINTDDDKEITLFRLFNTDFCLFSAHCIFHSLDYEVFIDIMKDTKAVIIPPNIVKRLNETEISFLTYINDLMTKRLSDAMWTIDQILSKRLDERIIDLLLNEYSIKGSAELEITQEEIAKHLGSSREVISRMLKHLKEDGRITIKRGRIILNDIKALL